MSTSIASLPGASHLLAQQQLAQAQAASKNAVPDSDGDHDGSTIAEKPASVQSVGAGSLINTKA